MLDRLGLANSEQPEIPLFAVNISPGNANKANQLFEQLIQVPFVIHRIQFCIEDMMRSRLLFDGVASIVDLLTKTKGLAQHVLRGQVLLSTH